jgi:hypothetical protein
MKRDEGWLSGLEILKGFKESRNFIRVFAFEKGNGTT